MNLREWRKTKGWLQGDLADKLGEARPTYQKMESGVGPISPAVEAKLRKLGFDGKLPRQEAKEAPAETIPAAYYREMGRLEGRLEAVERRLEEAFALIRDLKLKGP
jgi:transcriptional regulator with XRE-family HTH domain